MGAPRVLVAENDRMVTLLLARSLTAAGCHVTTVHDGLEAYEAGMTDKFDLAILGQRMPGLPGAEVLFRWKRELVDTPVIILSGSVDRGDVVKILDMGAADFIRKPFHLPEVLARARRRLRTGQPAGESSAEVPSTDTPST